VLVAEMDNARAALEQQLEDTRGQLAYIVWLLYREQLKRRLQQARAEAAEGQLRTFERDQMAIQLEQLLHTLVFREWLTALTDAEHREYPLGAYVLTEQLLEQLVSRPDLPREGIARLCAMVASVYPPGLKDIDQHPVLASPGGRQVKRSSDGATGWRCSLKQQARGAPRLQYWVRPDRTIEFTAIGGHDEIRARMGTRPEAAL
jgi:hypothetical protein